MLSLYDLIPADEGYRSINNAGDEYYVYLTAYSLLDSRHLNEEFYIETYMLGFNCKRCDPMQKQRYDAKSKATILSIFKGFLIQYPDNAFLYICDNQDGLSRNRRILFGRWFNEVNTIYERHHTYIKYGKDNWYSAIIIKMDNVNKQIYLDAYNYTLQQMLDSRDNE
ncbi:MAG: hypothetical protein JWR09_4265 [Mucilaginibacter sp.]|nr:hypothetical protein [Mucilaginibacter sp.]